MRSTESARDKEGKLQGLSIPSSRLVGLFFNRQAKQFQNTFEKENFLSWARGFTDSLYPWAMDGAPRIYIERITVSGDSC